jgi:competence protein ComEA
LALGSRSGSPSWFLCGAVSVGAQSPETDWFAPARTDPAAAEKELATLFRLVRHGSGPDRLEARLRMAALGRDAVPGLSERAEDGSHFISRNAALVLGEIRDPSSVKVLLRNAGEAGKGDAVGALLALGRIGDEAALSVLTVQAGSARSRIARSAAILALGALGTAEATARLRSFAGVAKLDAEQAAIVVALGMTAAPDAVEALVPVMGAREDRLRRAATAAAAAVGEADAVPALLLRLKDEDPTVRTAALEGLARCAPPDVAAGPAVATRLGSSDAEERAAAGAVLLARGGAAGAAFVERLWRDASEDVRAQTVAAAVGLDGAAFDALVARARDDRHEKVRAVAAIASAVRAGRAGRDAQWVSPRDDRDAKVRAAALAAEAWLRGGAARPALQAAVAARKDGDTVAAAERLLRILDQPEALAHAVLRAELQVRWDDLGVSLSWRPLARLNGFAIAALDAEDALPEEDMKTRGGTGFTGGGYAPSGGGAGPGGGASGGGAGGGGGPDRPRVRRRPPPEMEDLRRHLDRYPYADRRRTLEIPLLR